MNSLIQQTENLLVINLFWSAVASVVGALVALAVVIGQWRVDRRAGQRPWAALIPIYTLVVRLRLVGRPVWWVGLLVLPGVNLIVHLWVMADLARAFGWGPFFGLGLAFLPPIFWPWLAWSKADYRHPNAGLTPADPLTRRILTRSSIALALGVLLTLPASVRLARAGWRILSGMSAPVVIQTLAAPQRPDLADCGVTPSGIDTCLLQPGDVLIQKTNSLANSVFLTLGGTYFTHAALYVGDGRVVEAIGPAYPPEQQVVEWTLVEGEWTSARMWDWAILRPVATAEQRARAVAYARAAAADPLVTYDILAERGSATVRYCSLLVWQAYQAAGIDLETSPRSAQLDRLVTPDDLFYSYTWLSRRAGLIQRRSPSLLRMIWQLGVLAR